MTEQAKSSLHFRVIHGNKLLSEVKKITEPKASTAKTDSTSQDNLYSIKSRDVGWKDMGDMTLTLVDIGGSIFGDLLTLWKNGTKEVWEIAYAPVGSGRAITFTGFVSGVGHAHADDGGAQTIEVTVTPVSDFTILTTGAAGLTTGFCVVADDETHTLAPSPTFSGTTYDVEYTAYSSSDENLNSNTVTVTPTAAVGTIYVNGTVVASAAASGAIALNQTQGDVTYISIVVAEASKASKTYMLRVKMGTAAYA
jgi:hypothetical protein